MDREAAGPRRVEATGAPKYASEPSPARAEGEIDRPEGAGARLSRCGRHPLPKATPRQEALPGTGAPAGRRSERPPRAKFQHGGDEPRQEVRSTERPVCDESPERRDTAADRSAQAAQARPSASAAATCSRSGVKSERYGAKHVGRNEQVRRHALQRIR